MKLLRVAFVALACLLFAGAPAIEQASPGVIILTKQQPWTLQRLVNVSANGDSIYANAQHYDAAGNTIQWATQGFAGWLFMGMGWNYTSPKSYAVGGTDLATEQGYVTLGCNATFPTPASCGNWGDPAQFNTPMNTLSPPPDLLVQQGGINTCGLGLASLQSAMSSIMAAQNAVSSSMHILDLALNPYSLCTDATIRLPFNAWKAGTLDPSFGGLVGTINNDSVLEDPSIPGALNPIYAKETSAPFLHLNAKGGRVEAANIIANLAAANLLPAPIVFPVALDATNDPTNGYSTVGGANQAQRMLCAGDCINSCTTAGTNVTGTRPANWPISAASNYGVSSTVVSYHGNLCKLQITYPSATPTYTNSQVSVTGPTIPNGFFVAGHTYRTILTVSISSTFISNFDISADYVDNGVTSHKRVMFGSDDAYSVIGTGTFSVPTPEWTATSCSSSCTMTLRITINSLSGFNTSGQVQIYEPAVRELLYHATWP